MDRNRTEYFCYNCDQKVNVIKYPNGDIQCKRCGESFVEIIDSPISNSQDDLQEQRSSSVDIDSVLEDMDFSASPVDENHNNPSNANENSNANANSIPNNNGNAIHIEFESNLSDVFGTLGRVLSSAIGAQFQPPTANNSPPSNANNNQYEVHISTFLNPLLGNPNSNGTFTMGDYAGEDITAIVNRLMALDRQHYGPPPASSSFIDSLTLHLPTQEELSINSACSVCETDFSQTEPVLSLPCQHIFHKDCLLPWIKKHNTCPVCRASLPTDENQ